MLKDKLKLCLILAVAIHAITIITIVMTIGPKPAPPIKIEWETIDVQDGSLKTSAVELQPEE